MLHEDLRRIAVSCFDPWERSARRATACRASGLAFGSEQGCDKVRVTQTFAETGNVVGEDVRTLANSSSGKLRPIESQRYNEWGIEAVTNREVPRHEALARQGDTLLETARTKQGEEAGALYHWACEAYADALQLSPDAAEALVGLGCGHLALASRARDPGARQALLAQARRVLIAAEAQEAPAAGYNLACLCALDGNPEGCRMWVTRCEQRGQLPPAEQLLADPDLASVRREAWFAELAR
jgi:hypothetical protein